MPAPRDRPPAEGKGERVWTCDGCGKRAPWGKGWHWWCGVESWNPANRFDATSWWPAVACSDACEDVVLKQAIDRPDEAEEGSEEDGNEKHPGQV